MIALVLSLALGTTEIAGATAAVPRAATQPVLSSGEPCQIDIHGSINPGSGDYVVQSIAKANADNCGVLVITLDTPGGLLSSTRDMVKAELSAPLPVVVFVSPAGAQAGSAGVFITLAAHVAAMASGSNIGAAHPVSSGGKDIENEGGKDLAKKVENDTAAFMQSIATERHRNVEWAVKAVRESVSVTASEAMSLKVIDLVVRDEHELYDKLDGRTVQVGDRVLTLSTKGRAIRHIPMSVSQRMTNFFSDPQVSYLFMTFGMAGLLMEIYHPGAIAPGVVGAVALVLAFVSSQVVPIYWGGVALIFLGMVLLGLELVITSHGLLAVGGGISAVLGGLLLVNGQDPKYFVEPSFALHFGQVAPFGATLAALGFYLAFVVVRSKTKMPLQTGREQLLGHAAVVKHAIVPPAAGTVHLLGEMWNASADEALSIGTSVEVVSVHGLRVHVKRRA